MATYQHRFVALAILSLAAARVAACAVAPAAPVALADRMTLDERAVLRAEHVYQAAATVALAASQAGIIPASARPTIAAADQRAYAALRAMRAAYAAGNAGSYEQAGREAEAAMNLLLRALRR